MVDLKKIFWIFAFLPSFSFAATADYYTNAEFPYVKRPSLLERIAGRPFEPTIIPKALEAHAKDQELYSGYYVLDKPLYSNEILILADGPFSATVWRSGTEISRELRVLTVLEDRYPAVKQKMKASDYKILRLAVYQKPVPGSLQAQTSDVYQMPALIIRGLPNCPSMIETVQLTGYTGKAFYCDGNTFKFIPQYSYKAAS